MSAAVGAGAMMGPASASVGSGTSGSTSVLKTIEQLQFDNLALRALPVDKETKNFTREVNGACFSLVEPTPVQNPKLVCVSPDVLRWIELDPKEVNRPDFAEYFSGNKILPGARPAAHCYCGHQFGHFSGQLGDGATMYLGEIITSKNERIEIQFKGAGQTPYSRRADGRKVLRSSLREFLCSEANHYLGIPTTRAGTIVTSDTLVTRDIFYDGNAIDERATIITRLAHSFIRFGSFEIAKSTDSITGRKGPSQGRFDLVKQLLDYVVNTFYADVVSGVKTEEERYLGFFRELTKRTAKMVAKWQSVGWCHGQGKASVLNTDNMSILGITIDYGPFGYMEAFDPEYICNGSDSEGRYRYEAQPEICGWNLLKLSQNFESFIPKEKLRSIVGEYEGFFQQELNEINKKKFGLGLFGQKREENVSMEEKKENTPVAASSTPSSAAASASTEEKYTDLAASFYSTMAETGADFTNSFRCLSKFKPDDPTSLELTLSTLVLQSASLQSKLAALAPRIPAQQMGMIAMLMQTNPQLFEQPGMEGQLAAIKEEIERKQKRVELAKTTQAQKEAHDRKIWSKWLESYATILRDEMRLASDLGLSHAAAVELRRRTQNSANPKYILRNWIAQEVIQSAERGEYAPVRECLGRLRDPYDIDDLGESQLHGGQITSTDTDMNVAELEEVATKIPPTSGFNQFTENQQDQRCHQPPAETKCAIHWNKKRPDWANNLKVT